MGPVTTVRLALAGSRSDTARIALTAAGAAVGTLTLLAAATVLSVVVPPTLDGGVETGAPYTNELLNEAGLRPGVAAALLLLTIPILAFVAQCGRLGAPARDRRLAAVRLAGATPKQVAWVAAAETGLASGLGALLGLGMFLAGRVLLDAPDARGRRPLPTDVLPGLPWLATVVLGVPLLVTLIAVVALRRVVVTPLGVVRSVRTKPPRPWPGLLIVLGVGAFALVEPLYRWAARQPRTPEWATYAMGGLGFSGVLLVCVGVVAGTGWLTHTCGRVLHRFARRPAALLAGRRMTADPWAGSRTFAALLVALVIGGLAAGAYAFTVAELEANRRFVQAAAAAQGEPYIPDDPAFYLRAYELVGDAVVAAVLIAAAGLTVALVDGIVSRRRTFSALVAAGTPRGVLARATLWQVLTPIVPAIALATLIGVVLPRRLVRDSSSQEVSYTACRPSAGDPADACADDAYAAAHEVAVRIPPIRVPVEVPWEQLGLLAGAALAATVGVTLVGLLFLRMSTDVEEIRAT